MPNNTYRWFVVLDAEKARLLRASHTQKGSAHLDEIATLANNFTAGEHHRPDRLGTPGRSAGVGNEHAEKMTHFARQLTPWLTKELAANTIASCALFAPAHMLGALRKDIDKALAAKLVQHDLELAGLSNGQLAGHPRILALLAS